VKRLICFGIVGSWAVAVWAVPKVTYGEYATSLLRTDGTTITYMEDNDWDKHIETDPEGSANYGRITVGDYLVGMFAVQEYYGIPSATGDPVSPTVANFTGTYVLKVLEAAETNYGTFSRATITFGPAGVAWSSIVPDMADPVSGNYDETLVMFYSDSDSPNWVDQNPPTPATLSGALATATNGTKVWEFGYTGAAGETWFATTEDDDSTGGLDALDISQITDLSQEAAINNTYVNPLFSNIGFLKHDFVYQGGDGLGGSLGVFTDLQLTGGLQTATPDDEVHFDIATDSNFYLKVTPEPSSLVGLIGLGIMGLVGFVRYRWRVK